MAFLADPMRRTSGVGAMTFRLVVPLMVVLPSLSAANARAQFSQAPPSNRSHPAVASTTPMWVDSSAQLAVEPQAAPREPVASPSLQQVPMANQPDEQVSPQGPKAILGLGGGARIGIGEPTYPMIYGRAGVQLSPDIAISFRPAYIFGNSDQDGKRNGQGAFQAPLTLDLATRSWISPYIGFGIATNTDSNGKTDPMLSGGVDLRVVGNLYVAVGLNYILESGDSDNRDLEALSVIYYKF